MGGISPGISGRDHHLHHHHLPSAPSGRESLLRHARSGVRPNGSARSLLRAGADAAGAAGPDEYDGRGRHFYPPQQHPPQLPPPDMTDLNGAAATMSVGGRGGRSLSSLAAAAASLPQMAASKAGNVMILRSEHETLKKSKFLKNLIACFLPPFF